MKILGISAFYHDSAASLIEDGSIMAAAQEERFTRKKHDASFPENSIRFCLDFTDSKLKDLHAVVFYDKPLLKFERLLETYYNFSPKGWLSFIHSMPEWIRQKLFIKKIIRDELSEIDSSFNRKTLLLFPEHHLSHASSAFFASPFKQAAILTIDGVGEWATASLSHGESNQIKILKELHFPHSPGLLYSSFTYFLGFRVNSGEYKLMGLAPYGNTNSGLTEKFIKKIKSELVDIQDDGSIWLNQSYFQYATALRMIPDHKWGKLFGFNRRKNDEEIKQNHCDLALAIQTVTEEIVIKMAQTAKQLTGSENLCLAGGVALNAVANGKLHQSGLFKNIFVQPAAGDAGGAIGAALAASHIFFGTERKVSESDQMKGSFLGPETSSSEIEFLLKEYAASAEYLSNEEELLNKTAQLIADGNVIGWVQGRMEFGPRALGSRSILADPQNKEMQKKLNLKIKFRESFRPFAPSVLIEDCHHYFDHAVESPYMTMVMPLSEKWRNILPENYLSFNIQDKLYTDRSEFQAITHVDFSARIQTVDENRNPLFWKLISEFKKITGTGMMVNTSFNVRGEPIVNSAEDAYRCFMRTEMDYLVIGNYLFDKKRQAEWKEKLYEEQVLPID